MDTTNSKFKIQNSKLNNSSKTSRADSTYSGRATSMADLLKSVKTPFVRLQKGEVLKGHITKLTPAEILVDINAKTEAVVLEKDKRILRNILNAFKVGDEVTVSILNPESDMGHPVVSLRRYIDDILWKILEEKQKNQEPIKGIVREAIRGGFLIDSDIGMSGFLPNSQIIPSHEGDEQLSMPGKKVQLYILELERESRKVIFSQRPTLNEEEFNRLTKEIKVGQKLSSVIANITSFGVFVRIPINDKNVNGLIHISEVSWNKVDELSAVGNVGDTIEVVVIGIDREAKRIDVSIKRLEKDPFEEKAKAFAVDQAVSGTVKQLLSSGVVVDLGNDVEGFIRKEKIPPTVTYKEGDSVNATVSQIDIKRRKVMLVPVMLRKTIGYR